MGGPMPRTLSETKQVLNKQALTEWMNTVVAVQSPSRVQLSVSPWTAAHHASLSLTISWSLPKFISSMGPGNKYQRKMKPSSKDRERDGGRWWGKTSLIQWYMDRDLEEAKEKSMWVFKGKGVLGRRNRMCTGPEVWACVAGQGNNRDVVWPEQEEEEAVEGGGARCAEGRHTRPWGSQGRTSDFQFPSSAFQNLWTHNLTSCFRIETDPLHIHKCFYGNLIICLKLFFWDGGFKYTKLGGMKVWFWTWNSANVLFSTWILAAAFEKLNSLLYILTLFERLLVAIIYTWCNNNSKIIIV